MPLERLAKNLHGFFQRCIQAADEAKVSGLVLPPADPNEDFQEYADYFARALREFESPGKDKLSVVDLEPHDVFVDDPNREEQHPLHGNSKRYLDDPTAPNSQRFKRFRVEGSEAKGPVIEIIDWAMVSSDPNCMVGTSLVIPMYRK